MAEQEACADLVEKASEDITRQESKSSIHGESLLPLLQGLLDQPHDDQPADSGTESGEDLRSGLIIEVQSALDKLSASLRSSTTNISNDRRDSLLTLVSRLQAGLSSQITPSSSSERRSSLQGRFTKRKQRQNRHTVGVSTEELEDARKLMEEIAFNEPITIEGPELQKEDSTGSILSSASSYKSQTKQVKNTTAKPFVTSSNTSQSHSGTSSTVETPTETSESIDFPAPRSPDVAQAPKTPEQPPNFNHSTSVDPYKAKLNKHRPLSEAVSLDYSQGVDLIKIQKAITQAATIKQLTQTNTEISESDDDPSTVKQLQKEPEVPQQPKPDLIMQTNPIYSQPEESDDDVFVSNQYNEKANRFNSKKLKMKRANTIDIPKPLKYYEDEDESENEDLAFRRNSYLALRGPIRIGKLNVDKKVPEFQPKTDSDRKFVAFLNKHTDDKSAKVAPWSTQQAAKKQSSFGSIRSTFEKFQSPATNLNSAKNFWKSADDAITAGRVTHTGPKISKQSARNLQQMFEEKQKQNQYNSTQNQYNSTQNQYNSANIVTGSLKVDTKSLEGKKNVKIVTQPNQINQFSHAPMSAFKPVRKFEPIQPQPISNVSKVPLKTSDPSSPMYLYSPKPFNETPSPTNHAPWLARSGESRVLSIAASKFEGPQKERPAYGQRRPSKEKILIPPGLQHQEKLASPGIVRNLNQHTSVRKLSGQFESLKSDPAEYDPTRVFVPGENYTIQYDNKPKPKVYNAEYTITQRINLPPVVEDVKQNDEYIKQNNQYIKQNDQHIKEHNQKQLQAQPVHFKEPLQRQKSIGGYQQDQPKVFQQAPAYEADQQFTSNYQFKPKSPTKPKQGDDYISYESNKGRSSQENLQEYTAVSSKVMRGPVTQQAVTVQNAPKSRDQHDFERAFSLKATLEKFNQLEHNHTRPLATQSFKVKSQHKSLPEQNDVPKMVVYNNVGTKPVFCVNDKPLESLEINERGESVLTGKFSLPALSKSESWHQICQGKENLTNKPSPRASPNSRTVTRSKSSHTLAIPKQYEAGMSKAEMLEKQKSLEAYFGGKKTTGDVKKSTINRVKTSQKVSTQRQNSSSGLSRSKTLPDIVCLDRLDDSNIDEVFEEIFKSST